MKKWLSLVLGLVLLMSLAGGMAVAQGEEEPVTLVLASFYNTGSASGWDGLVAAFNEQYPNVTIEVQETGWNDYLTKLVSQLASGTSPDIIAAACNHIPKFVESDLLLSITDKIEADPTLNADDYFSHLLEYYTVDGQIYGLPYDAQPVSMFFYNKALFDEVGLEYPTEDWRWDDMRDAAVALTKKDDSGRTTQYGLLANNFMTFLYSGGGRIMDDIYNPTKCIIDSPEAIDSLQYMVDLMQDYGVMPTPDTLATTGVSAPDMFATGQVAMYNAGYWDIVDLPERWKDIDLGLTMFPASNEGNRGFTTGGTAYCVANGSEHADLAYEFVKYFMGEEGWEAAYNAATRGLIYPPAHIPSYEKFVLQNPDLPVDNVDVNGRSIEYAIFMPRIPLYAEMESKIINPVMDEILLGFTPVEDGLNDIAQRVNEAMETGEVY